MTSRDYPTSGLTVHWDGEVCAHSRICATRLPQVFRPGEQPWIRADAATSEEIATTIGECPSRALTYTRAALDPVAAPSATAAPDAPRTAVRVHENGPLELRGEMTVVGADGHVLRESRWQYFCRCGSSADKPFCDNSHLRVGFTDPGLGRP